MKRIFILGLILALVVIATPQLLYAKSENSKGPSKSEEKSNQGKNEDKSNKGQGSSQNQSDNGQGSKNQGKKDQVETKVNSNKGKGKLTVLESDESHDATKGAKLKKIEKLVIKEATASALSKRRAIQGLINSISGSIINLVHQIHRERTFQVIFGDATLIKFKSEVSSDSAKLQVGQRIVAVGDLNASGQLVAKRIHIIPGKAGGILKKNPIASGSASPEATSSPIPSPSL